MQDNATGAHGAAAGFRPGLVRWRQLIDAQWLDKLLDGAPVTAAPAGHWLLYEIGFGTLPAFFDSHIPGANYLDTTEFERAPLWNKVADAALLKLLLRHGIRFDTTVILYSRDTLAAARVAHLLLYAGVADVRLLDGGWMAWRAAGLPCAAGPGRLDDPATDFGAPMPAHPAYLLDMDDARALQLAEPGALVSVRTWTEFIGRRSGYSYIEARGEIPGAVWGRSFLGDNVNSMPEFHGLDGRMADPRLIARRWQDAGIGPGCRAVFYCGTGWRASLAFFYAWLMGWDDIGVFDGGWYEWSGDPANPVICRVDAGMASAVDIP